MHKFLRLLSLTIAAATSLGAAAQGHTIFVAGHANPCSPAIAGSTVTIASLGAITGVQTMATAVLNENCYYYAEILVADTAVWVAVEGPWGNGQNTVDTLFYSLTPPFTIDLIIDLNCGIAPPACQACISMDQTAPNTATFTSCSSGGVGPYTYLWDISGPGGGGVQGSSISHSFTGPGQYVVCLNLTDSEGCTSSTCQQVYVDAQGNLSDDAPNDCQACFNITQSQGGGALLPWSIDLTSCSVGSGTLLAEWQLPNGSWSNGNTITYVANSPGLNYLCLSLSSTNGCTSVFCDSVYFDTNGYLMNDPIVYAKLGAPRAWVSLLVYTGLRAGELARLRADQIIDGVIYLDARTKTGKPRGVPILPPGQRYIKHVPLRIGQGALRPYRYAARKAIGRPELRLHDLRHACASWLAQSGATTRDLQVWLGHTSPVTTARYAHLDVSRLLALARAASPQAKQKPQRANCAQKLEDAPQSTD